MSIKLNLELPISSVSFGQVSINILRELWRRGAEVSLFPIGPVDISAFDKLTPEFRGWLEHAINNRIKRWNRKDSLLRLWHLDGSQSSVIADRRALVTFYETNQPTEEELNTVANQDVTFLTSNFARDIFLTYGADETKVKFVPLGFDEDFGPTGKTYYGPDVVHFVLGGKFEARKNTAKIINLWAKKYGNDKRYRLTLAVFNPFLGRNEQEIKANNEAFLSQALEGKTYWNISSIGHMKTNSEVNDFLNSADIDLSGLSSGEGWNLGAFNATCLGKWSTVLGAHVHKDWATAENAVLVKPKGVRPAADNIFFRANGPFNNGYFFDIADDAIVEAMEKAEKLAHTPNLKGLELGKQMTYKHTVDKLLEGIGVS